MEADAVGNFAGPVHVDDAEERCRTMADLARKAPSQRRA
jgi:hypothetical protein